MTAAFTRRAAVLMFLAFAFAYFFSALLRAVTATMAPVFSAEMSLSPGDLGLLAGVYFLGFSLTQLPLGHALDRYGPRRVLLVLLSVAVLACAGFAMARGFTGLLLSRALIGVGVSACLMAPLTAYRHLYGAKAQLRANSWMLMTGSFGMLASTLPVQWLMPHWGWRGIFWACAAAVVVSMGMIFVAVPRDAPQPPAAAASSGDGGYRRIFSDPYFQRLAPLAFVVYGGMIAIQTLWAGPWLTVVAGWTAEQAASGLFVINLTMLCAFLAWGWLTPWLTDRGWQVNQLIGLLLPLSVPLLALNLALGAHATAVHWALWCVSCTVIALSQPALAQSFAPALAGRALSAFNLLVFLGVFGVQWGIGLTIDALVATGWPQPQAFRAAFALFGVGCGLSCLWFAWGGRQRAATPDKLTTMTRLLVIAHAPLASALKAVAEHTYPDCAAQLTALDVTPDMSAEQVHAQAQALLSDAANQPILVLTDVFGATPSNGAQRLADGERIKLVAGVNVPMLWRTLCYAHEPLDMLVQRALAGATQGVMQASPSRPQQQTQRDTPDGQDPHHHHQ
jgi:mannose/fructose-specific phosphotransferase system component IIA/predicted MFS family arabinose efflux permease